jgi:membrane AbrB-like protein
MRQFLSRLAHAPTVGPGVPATPLRVAMTLGIGSIGAVLFVALGVPLAWMLGAMAATTLATSLGAPAAVYSWMRSIMLAVLGVLLGSAFTPEIVGQMARWAPAIALLAVYLGVTMGLGYLYFTKIAGYDPVTAYFSAAQGGLSEMIALGDHYGGNMRRIALTHATRVLIIVAVVPLYFQMVAGADIPSTPAGTGAGGPLSVAEIVILCGCGLAGFWLGNILRLPAAGLVGPLILSSLAHGFGISQAGPPPFIIAAAQLVVGAAIGCRFAGLTTADMTRTIFRAIGSTTILIVSAVGLSFLAGPLVGQPTTALVLALSPGGLTEMALVSLSLGYETAFVATMHILRIAICVLAAPPLFRIAGYPGVDRTKIPD